MNLKNLNRSTKSNIITFGIVIGFYLLIQILSAAGMVTNSFAGQLVPICAYVVMAVSLNLTVGMLGELSLGHAGFMSVGAFAGTLVWVSLYDTTFPKPAALLLAFVVGGVVAGIFGFLVGIPVLRLSGDYLAIVTLAFGEIGLTGDLRAVQNGEKILREAGHLGFERVVLPIRNAERLKKTLASINKERQEKGMQPVKMVGIKNIAEVQKLF